MADIKISALPDAGDIQVGDTVPIVRGGQTLRSTSNPSITTAAMVGNAGDVVSVNPGEDGFALSPPVIDRISLVWNNSGNTNQGGMLEIGELTESLFAYAVDLTSMSILRTDSDSAIIEVLKNGTAVYELATAALAVFDDDASGAFAAGDVISVRNKAGSNTVSNCGVMLTFKRQV